MPVGVVICGLVSCCGTLMPAGPAAEILVCPGVHDGFVLSVMWFDRFRIAFVTGMLL